MCQLMFRPISPAHARVRRAGGRWFIPVVVKALILAGLPLAAVAGAPGGLAPAAAATSPTTTRVTVSATGGEMIADSSLRDATADGRYVLFRGNGPTNGYCACPTGGYELYRRDRQGGTVHVSANAAGQRGDQAVNYGGAISGDGRYVAFSSTSTNLVPGDTNAAEDVFVKDVLTGAITRASVATGGTQADKVSGEPAISADGRYVAYRSTATNLVAGDTNGFSDIFVFDRVTAGTERVSLTSTGAQGTSYAYRPSLSADGRLVVFDSSGSFAPGDGNYEDVFIRDRLANTTELVSRADPVGGGDVRGMYGVVSADGRHVAYMALVGPRFQVYRYDRQTATTQFASLSTTGQVISAHSMYPSISGDGRAVIFESDAALVAADTNAAKDVYVRDFAAGTIERVSVGPAGEQGGFASYTGRLSSDGALAFFASQYPFTGPEPSLNDSDVFARDRGPRPPVVPALPASRIRGGPVVNAALQRATTLSRSDPVDTATGAFVVEVTDAALPGAGVGLELIRSYTSTDATAGPLGPGWTHTYAASLAVGPGGDATVRAPSGAQLAYTRAMDGSFTAPAGALGQLSAVGLQYQLVDAERRTWRFDAAGRLSAVVDRSAAGLSLSYDGAGRLATVTDAAGRATTLAYNPAGLMARFTMADGRVVSYTYSAGRLSTVTDPAGGVTTYTYDPAGRLAAIVDPNGNAEVRNTYDGSGRVVRQLDALGHATTFSWNPATETATMVDAAGATWTDVYRGNVLVSSTEPAGTTTVFWDSSLNPLGGIDARGNAWSATYDGAGNLLTRTAPAPLSYVETWTYDATGNPLRFTDGRGNTSNYVYDGVGRLTTTTWPGGASESRTYTAIGQLATLTDARAMTTSYTYDDAGNLVSSTSPSGRVTTYTHDATGRLSSTTDPLGRRTSYGYDGAGRRLTETDPLGRTTRWAYDATGNLVTATDPAGAVTTYAYNAANEVVSETGPGGATTTSTYDARGLRTASTDAAGNTTTFAYDGAGRMVSRVDPRGNQPGANPDDFRWTYAYDGAGNQITVTDPLGGVTASTYDVLGRLTSVTDPRGAVTAYAYDANSNQVSATDPLGAVTTSTYDATDRLVSVRDPLGKVTTYAYDGVGNRTGATSPSGAVTTWSYDDDGATVATADPLGRTTTFAYDAAGRRLGQSDPTGATTSAVYDGAGQVVSRTDANGHTTTNAYGPAGTLASVSGSDGAVTAYSYDGAGRLARRSDANGHATTFAYDPTGRLISNTAPDGRRWTYAYDAAGNRTTVTDAAGATATSAYDAAGRLATIDYPGATPDVTFSYDAAGNRTSMADGAGTETATYDAAGRLTTVARGSQGFSYAYDAVGQIATRTYPDGSVTTSTYDGDGRLASVATAGATTNYTYDAASQLRTVALPNGVVDTRTYDGAGRVATISQARGATTIASFAYSRDGVGNPTSVVAGTGTQSYAYDGADRLMSACRATSCAPASAELTTWTYDGVGNRTTQAVGGSTTTYAYDTADRLVSSTTGSATVAYGSDPNGNLTTAGASSFSYDAAGRMGSATVGNTTWSYTYDGDGRRLSASTGPAPGDTVRFAWDAASGLAEVATESDGAGTVLRRYAHDLSPVSMSTGGTEHYYLSDGLGSITALTSSAGTLEWSYAYSPFGTTATATQLDPAAPANPLGFTGQYQDPTGLYHLRARQYDPTTGRFGAIDPLAPQTADPYVSAYAYVDNRPTVLVDPSGQRGVLAGGGLVSQVAGCLFSVGGGTACLQRDPRPAPNPAPPRPAPPRPRPGSRVIAGTAIVVTACVLSGLCGPNPPAAQPCASPQAPVPDCDDEWERVGRWMSPTEYGLMRSTNAVQVGGGNTTYVSRPPNPDVNRGAPSRGSYFVEFEVPSQALFPGGQRGSAQIPGPGHRLDILSATRGRPIPRPVPARNIVHAETKP